MNTKKQAMALCTKTCCCVFFHSLTGCPGQMDKFPHSDTGERSNGSHQIRTIKGSHPELVLYQHVTDFVPQSSGRALGLTE